jgi:excisionase family DNA binding protein
MPIVDLFTHEAQFVTVGELAEYWAVSRQQIYKRIESGSLPAIRLGSRLYRVRTRAALEFERQASVYGESPQTISTGAAGGTRLGEPASSKAALRRVPQVIASGD